MNTTELVDQVRSQLDEFNESNVTDAQILQALNRANRSAARITNRALDTVFLNEATLSTVAGQREYDMPSDIFGNRIEKVELKQGNVMWRIQYINYMKREPFVTSSQVIRPYYYDIVGRKIRLYPTPAADLEIRLHYARRPESFVAVQGQINSINVANNYVIVDNIGDDLTTESDQRNSYVNFIDRVTGDVKGTCQLAFKDEAIGQLKFKTSGLTRTEVLGKTISTSLPSDLSEDDYVCVVRGTAVPQWPEAYQDYLIQYSITELKRRFGEPTTEDYAALKDLEADIKKMWAGRETRMRIRKASSHWTIPLGGTLRRYLN